MTGDLAEEFFASDSPEWWKLHNRLRLDIGEALAKEGISVITPDIKLNNQRGFSKLAGKSPKYPSGTSPYS